MAATIENYYTATHHHDFRRAEMVALVAAGCSYNAVFKLHGIPLATIHRWVHTDLIDPPKRNSTISPRRRRAIMAAIDAGNASLRAIARTHGVAHRSVANIRDRLTIGGSAPRPHRCPGCRAKIVTRVCLSCSLASRRKA
jgi:transposase